MQTIQRIEEMNFAGDVSRTVVQENDEICKGKMFRLAVDFGRSELMKGSVVWECK
jgi:hypothetical protein